MKTEAATERSIKREKKSISDRIADIFSDLNLIERG